MYNVLIVEDEILARIGLRQLLDWEKRGFFLLPDAADGREALLTIREQEPDIILLDLNIPEISGLQLLKIIHDEQIDSQVIIVSCHEEFEMVKEAMKLGAYDYLRKLNLSAEEMESVLNRCIEERNSEIHTSIHTTEVRYDEIIYKRGRNIFDSGRSYLTLCSLSASGEKTGRLYEFAAIMKDLLYQRQEAYVFIHKDVHLCYFLFEEQKSAPFFDALYHEIKSYFPGWLYLGFYNKEIKTAEDLTQGIAIVEQITLAVYYDEKGQVIFYDKILETKEHSPSKTYSRENELQKTIHDFQKEETDRILKKLIHTMRAEKYISINVLRRVFMDILGFFSMTAKNLGRNIEELCIQETNCHYQKLMQINSLTEIEKWFLALNQAFCEQFYIDHKSSGSELLRDVFTYIDAHLSETIQLSEAARAIGVSSAYLSTFFKKEIGYNFIEYVNMKKVEAAKDQLHQGQLVQEVSEGLGFENSTYFSKVFKKYTGVTPAKW